ncbi:hypothetical protein [Novosphingobium colocasiae]|uniref:hypothetical protein n=1 Tax=Novosphingobium colocasiae TaxID=1256513 RepID=UPI0035B24912
MIRIDLPYPHLALWPNGRAHRSEVARQVKKHRAWAHDATMADPGWRAFAPTLQGVALGTVPVHLIVSRKAAGVYPDRDNTVAAAKSLLDGIAQRLGINDKLFAAPTVEFIAPITGRFLIQIGSAPR